MMESREARSVTVVIPTYNRADLLRRCLCSLVEQTFKNFDVVVCDDGSTDHTGSVTSEFSTLLRMRYLWAANSGGAAVPRNRGWRASSATYIAFLDSDDWWTPEKLQRCFDALERGADLVFHDLYICGEVSRRGKRKILRSGTPKEPVTEALLCSGLSIPNSSVVVRRSILEEVGGFCEESALTAVEDLDCWIRASRVTERFEKVKGVLGFYWIGSDNISAASLVQVDRLRAVYDRNSKFLMASDQCSANAFLEYRSARVAIDCRELNCARLWLESANSKHLRLGYRLKSIIWLMRIHFQEFIKTYPVFGRNCSRK